MKQAIRLMLVVASVVGVVLALSGCATSKASAGGSGVDYSTRVVVAGEARLDPSTDSAHLPLDDYSPSDSQNRIIDYAIDLSVRSCMAAKGQQFAVYDRRKGHDTAGFRLFGLWVADEAANYGYAVPPQDAADLELSKLNAQTQTPEQQTDYSACLDLANKNFPRKDPSSTLAAEGSEEAYSLTVSRDKSGVAIVRQWRSCMKNIGVTIKQSDLLTVGVGSMSQEQQVQVAVEDVECKTRINAVQRLADIDASYQEVFVAKKQASLNDEKSAIESVTAKAQAYIASAS